MNFLFKKCDKPNCDRQVKKEIAYCCGACDLSPRETKDDGIIFSHTNSCNIRHFKRGSIKNPNISQYSEGL